MHSQYLASRSFSKLKSFLNDYTHSGFNSTADKDWEDIKFGVDNQVDFYAVSFVKDAKVVHELKNYLKSKYVPFSSISYQLW